MPRPLKKILRLFLGAVLFLLIVAILTLKTPLVLEGIGPVVLNAWLPYRYPGCRLKIIQLSIAKKSYRFPETLVFDNFDLVFKLAGDEYRIGFDRAEIEGVAVLLGEKKIMRMDIRGVDILAPQGHVSNANLKFLYNEAAIDYTRGIMTDAMLKVGVYELSDMKSRLFVNPGRLVFEPFSAGLYGGTVRGKITLDYRYAPDYQFRVKLESIDLKQLESVNPAVFSQVRGVLAGDVAVDGVGNKIRSLNSSFEITKQGSLKAVLLSPFVSYIPPSKARSTIEALIESGGYMPFSQGKLQVERLNSKSLRAVVDLRSPVLHLEDSQIIINLDAALGERLRIFLQSIPGKGGRP